MAARIPNLNTLSTLLDRLSIENVKVAHFQNALEHDELSAPQRQEFSKKIETQDRIIGSLKEEVATLLEEILFTGKYDYIREERTFK